MNRSSLDLMDSTPTQRASAPFEGEKVWTGDTLRPESWRLPIPPEVMDELERVVAFLRTQQLPVYLLRPEQFALSAAAGLMSRVRDILDDGAGLAQLDRLPLDRWSRQEATAVYWLLGQLLEQPVAQEWDGMIFKDILNEGGGQTAGNERAVTNNELVFHTDNSGNKVIPNYVSLFCLQPALEGGHSRICSLYPVHNAMLEQSPALLERLYGAYYHDRLGIQTPGTEQVLKAPVFSYDGERLLGRYSLNKIGLAYRNLNEQMDDVGREALDGLVDTISRDGLAMEMKLEKGQVQYFNNRECLHHRSGFTDHEEPAQRRHMLRLWYRKSGLPFFDG